ncbi:MULTISPECIES: hypothetical protein [unclassified Pseudomonas]|uniref:hypothetical protein n=1 Tax=unclassified Pseudomonas TaxID=196821 RepID=UPI00244ABFA1|nr:MULTISPECIES: hypothetical protein [unclassified Pseudomonas]MDH0303639.1 hypothetical protein [Pseudomonas sp. GD04091]MDH1987088.1 hypothetical protein [Pseudomonas sp. GD03689]
MTQLDHLANYVSAILGLCSPRAAHLERSHQETWLDQGFTVTAEEKTYAFDDGTLIKRLAEQDNFPCDGGCAECWISYQVIRQPRGAVVSPTHISFTNPCREAYWLRYFSA